MMNGANMRQMNPLVYLVVKFYHNEGEILCLFQLRKRRNGFQAHAS